MSVILRREGSSFVECRFPKIFFSLACLLAVGRGTTDPEGKPISISFPLSLLFTTATADPQTAV